MDNGLFFLEIWGLGLSFLKIRYITDSHESVPSPHEQHYIIK